MSTNTLASALAAARDGGPTPHRAAAPVADEPVRLSDAEALQIAIRRSVRTSEDVAARRLLLGVPGFAIPEGFAR